MSKNYKKVLAVLCILILAFSAIIGCGKKETLGSLVPDPHEVFPNGNINIWDTADGDSYMFAIKDATADDFKTYMNAAKDAGFGQQGYEDNTDFAGYSESGKWWIEVHYVEDATEGNYINVISDVATGFDSSK